MPEVPASSSVTPSGPVAPPGPPPDAPRSTDPSSAAPGSPAADPVGSSPGRRPGKDRLLDLIRITAIGRVILWHTWSWAWLTWVPAMPAMFFVTGALLDGSLGRRGWWATTRSRLRRLLIPYWVYAAACWVVMLVDGWRPTVGDAARWAVPLLDPVGSDELPGLWIPLWYLRAYLWFLLAAGVIRWVQRRWGAAAVVASALAAVGLWAAGRRGWEVPLAVGDAVTYLPFVMAGVGYGATRRVLPRAALGAMGVASAVAALVVWQRYGPDDGVVNRSYLLTMLVGFAGVSIVFAFRTRILTATERGAARIDRINSRALTIYLWQGFGLVAAQRLVDQRLDPGPLRVVLSLVVVVAVIAGAVVLFGSIEDRAARRTTGRADPLADQRDRSSVRFLGFVPARPMLVLISVGLVGAALVVGLPEGATVEAPLSGQAVVARGGLIEEQLEERTARADVGGLTPQQVLEEWVEEQRDMLERIETRWIDASVAGPDGTVHHVEWNPQEVALEETIAWWSMTKAMTSAWMLRLAERGVVARDDPLARWVPETPRAEDMTLEQLASHTSGVPPEVESDLMEAHPADEIDAFVERGELAFEPGEGYGYSRVGYYLLALALERASGMTWSEGMEEMADAAGVELWFDDGIRFTAPVSDPDGHGYRGGLWSSGGLISRLDDAAGVLQWLFTDGLSDDSIDTMSRFPADEERHYYGLGLVPMCPCELDGEWIRAERFGLDTASGTFAVDRDAGAAVMMRPEGWWDDEGPVTAFYDLQQRLLDSVVGE